MRGTVLCAIDEEEDGRRALELALELSERLGLRLVLAHVRDGIAHAGGDGHESVSMRGDREGAARLVARLADEYGVGDSAESRSGIGDAGALIGRIAAEEAADVVVVGAQSRGRLRRRLDSRLASSSTPRRPCPS
jgi:nucleotide-binding universal stress UspA family protein